MAGDDFALAVVGDTDWAWGIDAVLAAVAATWPQTTIRDSYRLAGSKFRARATFQTHAPDAHAGDPLRVRQDDRT